MIKAYLASARGEPLVGVATWPNSGDVVGVDLLNGTPREIPKVEKATGLRVPSLASLSEIQHSSRMRHEGDLLILSLPMPRETADTTTLVPIGFLLRPDILLTVRFGIEVIFDDFALGWAKGLPLDTSALSVLTGLFEVTVDSVADRLEEIGANLDIMAGKILTGTPNTTEKGGGSNIKDKPLRELLREIGHTGQLLGKLRASLLTAGRIVPYVESEGSAWFKDGPSSRLGTVKADIESLNEYETHLSDKVQFLLDATLGLINMEQNDLRVRYPM